MTSGWDLPFSSDAPTLARRHVETAFATDVAHPSVIETAKLLVSEAVTNAVCHGSGPIHLGLDATSDGWELTVRDHSSGHPNLQAVSVDNEGGRGLLLIDALASAWGTRALSDGSKELWFTLPAAAGEARDKTA